MSYATAAQMLLWHGARELVETATPDDMPLVTGELMRLTIEAGNRDAFTDEELAAVDLALARLEAALTDAGSLMDAYLARRYALPLTVVQVSGSPLPRLCAAIARYLLRDDRATREVAVAYQQALEWLGRASEGRVGLNGAAMGQGAGEVRFEAPARVFDHDTLRGFV